jgi:hypothetical protein
MEWLTIVLSSLLTLLTPAGAILDRVLTQTIRAQVKAIDQLAVRVDNTPSYQVLQGKVDRVRISGRGIYPLTDVRIDTIELETDPLNVDLQRLQQRKSSLTSALRQPASAAVRVVLREIDVNKALQSPLVQKRVQELIDRWFPKRAETGNQSFQLREATINLMHHNRIAVTIVIQPSRDGESGEPINLALEVGLNLVGGRRLQLNEPSGTLNGRRLSTRLLKGFAEGLSEPLDLNNFEKDGITARLLQWQIDDDKLQVAAFARIDPRSGNTGQP